MKNLRRTKFGELWEFVIILVICFIFLVYLNVTNQGIDNEICFIMAVTIFLSLMIIKAAYILWGQIEREQAFIVLFLLQEIRKEKVESEEDLTRMIYGTVDELHKFSSIFYKIFDAEHS